MALAPWQCWYARSSCAGCHENGRGWLPSALPVCHALHELRLADRLHSVRPVRAVHGHTLDEDGLHHSVAAARVVRQIVKKTAVVRLVSQMVVQVADRRVGVQRLFDGSVQSRLAVGIQATPERRAAVGFRKLRIPFEWFKLGFECFESLTNGSSFHLNASNPF